MGLGAAVVDRALDDACPGLARSILDAEDFPAAESCQRGFEAGSRPVIGGVGESLIGHWHETWDAALAELG